MSYRRRLRTENIELYYEAIGEQDAFYVLIGNRLRIIRESLMLSQEVVADQLGIGQSAYSKIETGRTQATAWQIVEIARVLSSSLLSIIPPPN